MKKRVLTVSYLIVDIYLYIYIFVFLASLVLLYCTCAVMSFVNETVLVV